MFILYLHSNHIFTEERTFSFKVINMKHTPQPIRFGRQKFSATDIRQLHIVCQFKTKPY